MTSRPAVEASLEYPYTAGLECLRCLAGYKKEAMYIVVLVTAGSKKEAAGIAKKLIKEKLAACVNIIGKADSLFWWKGAVDASVEALLVIKSKKSKFGAIVQAVKSAHSYEVPEIIALPIVLGEESYLRWIDGALR